VFAVFSIPAAHAAYKINVFFLRFIKTTDIYGKAFVINYCIKHGNLLVTCIIAINGQVPVFYAQAIPGSFALLCHIMGRLSEKNIIFANSG